MTRRLVLVGLFAVGSGACSHVSPLDADAGANTDDDGNTDADSDVDADTDSDTDADTYSDADFECSGEGVWYDDTSGLCWQDPPSGDAMNWYRAAGITHPDDNPEGGDYCGDLVHGGYQDWRLPNIDELITLVRGCQNGTTTGDLSPSPCTMIPEGCVETDSCTNTNINCDWCSFGAGPGGSGCYWDPALIGWCTYYWSSSSRPSSASFAWNLYFEAGYVSDCHKADYYDARCVRSGP